MAPENKMKWRKTCGKKSAYVENGGGGGRGYSCKPSQQKVRTCKDVREQNQILSQIKIQETAEIPVQHFNKLTNYSGDGEEILTHRTKKTATRKQ